MAELLAILNSRFLVTGVFFNMKIFECFTDS